MSRPLPTSSIFWIAALLAGIALSVACSSSENTDAKADAKATPAARSDPHMEALKAQMDAKRKRHARDEADRVAYHTTKQAERVGGLRAGGAKPAETPPAEGAGGAGAARSDAKRSGSGRVGGGMALRKGSAPAEPAGTIDRSALIQTFRKRQNTLQNCYERGLKRNPDLRGKVTLTLTINAKGGVSKVNVGANTLGDAAVTSCMTGQVKRWTFPAPEGGQVTVSKSFIFSPQT